MLEFDNVVAVTHNGYQISAAQLTYGRALWGGAPVSAVRSARQSRVAAQLVPLVTRVLHRRVAEERSSLGREEPIGDGGRRLTCLD